MDLRYRRIIYITFIVMFALAAIGLLLYAQGYKYNKLKGRIEKTGAMAIESEPPGAQVKITQQTADGLTPLNWNRLPPDEYDVTLNLEGYQTWTKKLTVRSGQVTQTGKIKLWPSDQLGTLLPETSNIQTWLSPNQQNLLYLSNQGLGAGLWLLNLVSGDAALLSRPAANQIIYVEWSPSNRQILTQLKNSAWQIINLTDNTTKIIGLPPALHPQIMHWSSTDTNILYFSTATELYQFNLDTNSTKLLARDQLVNFIEHQGLLFILSEQSKGGIMLKILNPKNLQEVPLNQSLPLSTDFIFLEKKNDWLPLLDANRHQLYLLRSPLKSLQPVIKLPEAINIDWSPDEKKLLFYNNFEVWSYSFDNDRSELLYRVSSVITKARWYNDQYILINTNNQLIALELDSRNRQQSWILFSQNQPIIDFFLEPQGKIITIHYTGGLVRLLVTEPAHLVVPPPANSPATVIQTFQRLSTNL